MRGLDRLHGRGHILLLLPRLELPGNFWNVDKAYHFATYAWLGGLAVLSLRGKKKGLLAAAGMVVLGALLEWGQSFVPGRDASLGDATANALGVLLGVWCAAWLRKHAVGVRGESFPPDPLKGSSVR